MKNLEIERKFLLISHEWRKNISRVLQIQQGYLADHQRVRIVDSSRAFITQKSKIDNRENFKALLPKYRQEVKIKEFIDNWLLHAPEDLSLPKQIRLKNDSLVMIWQRQDLNTTVTYHTGFNTLSLTQNYAPENKTTYSYASTLEPARWIEIEEIIKQKIDLSFTLIEDESEIEFTKGLALLLNCEKIIDKTRYIIEYRQQMFEIDIFNNLSSPLELAEIELRDEHQVIDMPAWLGVEVTYDPKYKNINLIEQTMSLDSRVVKAK